MISGKYGPDFQVIKGFYLDKDNPKRCWVQIKLDENHFTATQKAGWFLHPCIIFLFICFCEFILIGMRHVRWCVAIGLATKAGKMGIPYCMDEIQFFRAPETSEVHAIIEFPPEWDGGLTQGVSKYGNAHLYPF